MKKISILALTIFIVSQGAFALDNVFDSMDSATEVKLAPAITSTKSTSETKVNALYQ